MSSGRIRVVLNTGTSEADARVRQALGTPAKRRPLDAEIELVIVPDLATGLLRVDEGKVDALLLGLPLFNTHPADTLARIRKRSTQVPIIVLLTGTDDERMGVQAMHAGALDYLAADEIDATTLRRSLRYARDRHELHLALHTLSLTDEVTSLYNRRGFFTHADRAMKLAPRTQGLWVLLFGLEGLKAINDRYGYQEGDRALAEVAALLRETCRDSDILSHFGADEFAVALVDSSREAAGIITSRLEEKLLERNRRAGTPYELAATVGLARREPQSAYTLDQLLTNAENALHQARQRGHQRA